MRGVATIATLLLTAAAPASAGDGPRMTIALSEVAIARASGLTVTAATVHIDGNDTLRATDVRFATRHDGRPVHGTATAVAGSLHAVTWLFCGLELHSGHSTFASPLASYDSAAEQLTTSSGIAVDDPRMRVRADRAVLQLRSGHADLAGNVRGSVRP